jgi:hypothetical protein
LLLENFIAFMETSGWRRFLMNDLDALEEDMRMGAEMCQGIMVVSV